ncbi:hypothetical protein Q9K02_00125 [Qipengyuania sp. G39]|uniref:Uncharacterized protein n=1 Tax=Qipengyuania profundimaris TaxID=3067652 RepID=A0ABT9HK99_9SPHN|nr:hypothetical protein [Qipengyuania sp. G39]MDP4573541.1 hypothetical protein [Qipengyuania sp. G39]
MPAQAGDGVYLPPAPQGPGGEDSIETADGTRCRQSINSNGPYLDVGAAGQAASPLPRDSATNGLVFLQQDRDREGLVYMRVTVPLGKKPTRIDCSRLYEMEIARLRREVEMLRMAAE